MRGGLEYPGCGRLHPATGAPLQRRCRVVAGPARPCAPLLPRLSALLLACEPRHRPPSFLFPLPRPSRVPPTSSPCSVDKIQAALAVQDKKRADFKKSLPPKPLSEGLLQYVKKNAWER